MNSSKPMKISIKWPSFLMNRKSCLIFWLKMSRFRVSWKKSWLNSRKWWPAMKWPCSYLSLMIITMPSLKFTRALVVQRPRIGEICCCVCIHALAMPRASKLRSWTIKLEMKQALSRLHFHLKDRTLMVCSSQKWESTVWSGFRHSTQLNVVILPLHQ